MAKYKFLVRIYLIAAFIYLQQIGMAQSVGGGYYTWKAKETQIKEESKPVDIYLADPLFVGVVNHIKIQNINLQENIASGFAPFIETAMGEYDASFLAPCSTTLYLKNKVSGKISYVLHYNVKRLPKDELKEEPILMLGNRNLDLIGIADLKAQKQITITGGFKFKSAVLYFAGNGFPVVYTSLLTQSSLQSLDSLIAKCQTGATITFDNIKVTDKNGKEYTIRGETYKVATEQEANKAWDNTLSEFRRLINLNFIGGTIFFSGASFINVQQASGSEINTLKYSYSQLCTPGSIIVFDNCVYKDEKGVLVTLNKTIKLP